LARAGFVLKYLQRVLRTLSSGRKRIRIALAGPMLQHPSLARYEAVTISLEDMRVGGFEGWG
jgi:hypothetical protein